MFKLFNVWDIPAFPEQKYAGSQLLLCDCPQYTVYYFAIWQRCYVRDMDLTSKMFLSLYNCPWAGILTKVVLITQFVYACLLLKNSFFVGASNKIL